MNHTVSHPTQPEMQVEVILASQGPDQKPVYTIRMRYPRIIHGEIMTHRLFSRNARSSRAVPVKTMLNEVHRTPFIPWHWGKNQKGMQSTEDCHETVRFWSWTYEEERPYDRVAAWLEARDSSLEVAEAFMDAGYHKQIVNRLLEPFSWIDMLITSTDWSNFLWLRDHKDAEPHLQDLARLVKQAIDETEVQQIEPGEWHLPYITNADREEIIHSTACGLNKTAEFIVGIQAQMLQRISAARCARISYKPFDGDSSYEKELSRYDMLVSSDRVHASPTEHQATPDYFICGGHDGEMPEWSKPYLHGNLEGYIQSRKLIPNERAWL